MSEGEKYIIKRVKKRGHEGGHHGGAWKVAYADFVTAMMALFIVLWIVANNVQVRASVADYFRDPGAIVDNGRQAPQMGRIAEGAAGVVLAGGG